MGEMDRCGWWLVVLMVLSVQRQLFGRLDRPPPPPHPLRMDADVCHMGKCKVSLSFFNLPLLDSEQTRTLTRACFGGNGQCG